MKVQAKFMGDNHQVQFFSFFLIPYFQLDNIVGFPFFKRILLKFYKMKNIIKLAAHFKKINFNFC
jgi:hypothetical protein